MGPVCDAWRVDLGPLPFFFFLPPAATPCFDVCECCVDVCVGMVCLCVSMTLPVVVVAVVIQRREGETRQGRDRETGFPS
jgi:hypothetical protein